MTGLFAATVAHRRQPAPARRFPIGWVVVAAPVHALVVELVQHAAIPGRSGDPLDVLFDVVGIALGPLWAGERMLAAAPLPSARWSRRPCRSSSRSAEGLWIPAAPACGGVSRSA